jgi:mono/diheme cytochrome c family protein
MAKWILATLFLSLFHIAACSESKQESPQALKGVGMTSLPDALKRGETLFNANCAACHGEKAAGTGRGPTFLSKIYEPNHHSDASFHLAVQNGVRAHHWQFGDMPKIPGVGQEDVNEIVGYVRWLQQQVGIF